MWASGAARMGPRYHHWRCRTGGAPPSPPPCAMLRCGSSTAARRTAGCRRHVCKPVRQGGRCRGVYTPGRGRAGQRAAAHPAPRRPAMSLPCRPPPPVRATHPASVSSSKLLSGVFSGPPFTFCCCCCCCCCCSCCPPASLRLLAPFFAPPSSCLPSLSSLLPASCLPLRAG